MKRVVMASAALLVGFSTGFWSGAFQTFPYDLIRSVKRTVVPAAAVPADPRIDLFSRFTPRRDVVMLGDSLTQNGLWSDFFTEITVANRGIGGDTTAQILARLNSVLAMRPDTVFIMAGINDLFDGVDLDQVEANYTAIVDELLERGINVVIQSTLTCLHRRCQSHNLSVRNLNNRLMRIAESRRLRFVNLESELFDGDEHRNAFTFDGVHLNADGYARWVATIMPLMPQSCDTDC